MTGNDTPVQANVLTDLIDGGLFVLDENGRVVWATPTFEEIVGVESVAAGRPRVGDLLAVEGDAPGLGSLRQGRKPTSTPVTISGREEAFGEVVVAALPDGGTAGVLRDRTTARRRERKLDRYRTVLQAVDDGVYTTDENRRLTWINEPAAALLGYDRERFQDEGLFSLLDDAQVEKAKENLEYLLSPETPEVITFEMDLQHREGHSVPVEVRSALLPGDGFTGTVGIVRDVSGRKARERELVRKNERLERFTETVTHDLRNPMSVAAARLELAREDCASEHLADVEDALGRLETILDELRSLAREGREIGTTERVRVASVARESWETVATGRASVGIAAETVVEADPIRLRRALENLFRNAVEHTDGDVRIRVGDLEDDPGFYVADDGPGIEPEDRTKIFETGFSTGDAGTGSGLAIVQRIVDDHGWTVRVRESTRGGARFDVVTE